MARIIVVDDEPDICDILKFNLENVGHTVDTASSGEEALGMDLSVYELFLLDVMMDSMSGYELAKEIHAHSATSGKPIIFITAKASECDVLKGFNLGADDYIGKPFRISEVIARVNAVLRRVQQAPLGDDVHYGTLVLSPDSKRATLNGCDISLTKKEFEMLLLLLKRPGKVFSREEILEKVWPDDVNVLERSIDVCMARLRKKLGQYAANIVSRSGYGYCFLKLEQE